MSQPKLRAAARSTRESNSIDLLVEIARAYYEQNHNQDKIAKSLGISRSQVSRYLSRARQMNLVQVRIVAPGERAANLERALKRRFKSLKDAVVASAFNIQPEPLRKTIGRACADYLAQKIRPGLRVCIGSGRTLREAIGWIHPHRVPDVSIVQAMGSVGHEAMNIDFAELARAAGLAFDARVYYLNAPAILGSGSTAALAAANPSIRESLQLARSADLYVVGVGSMESDLLFTRAGLIKDRELDQLSRAGAVGDVCARFFDRHGREVPSPFAERVVGIQLGDLHNHGFTIGVGGGPDKVVPLLGALRGGLFNAVVTDEHTARSVIDLDQTTQDKEVTAD
jgi:DNA-binding transcriptional regulator LsrR (DeoR family)